MTNNLKSSIDNLYAIFARYQGLSRLEGSPLYDELATWTKALRSKPLKELDDEDLSRFAGSVILAWGDENDYRYYLPRICELTAGYKTPYDIWTLYSRLEDANWKTWEAPEQDAINEFSLALWENLVQDTNEKAEWEFKDYFHALAYFYLDFSELLRVWESADNFAAVKHLTNYIFDERQNLFDKQFINGTEKNTKNIAELKAWLLSDKLLQKLEKAFYDHEKEEIAERISWVEHILNTERNHSG